MDAFSTGPHVFQIVHWNIAKSENTTSTYLIDVMVMIVKIVVGVMMLCGYSVF